MNLTEFAERIKHLDYVVQRHWEGLPEKAGDDLDLFVSNADYETLKIVASQLEGIKVDIRQPGDGYYPLFIGKDLLHSFDEYGGFKIPQPLAAWNALYYHNAVHKKDHPYDNDLRRQFLEFYPPVWPDDKGVGYYPNQ